MFFRRNKYDKLTREEVVEAICKLETEEKELEEGLGVKQQHIDTYMQKGKTERSREMKLFYAKKINALKAEREQDIRRITYLMYNVQMLQKLKTAIDDNKFFKNTAKTSLGNLLADQKGLARFLNQALGTRVAAEDVLTSADETFRAVEEAYEPNQAIYGKNEQDDELLAMFETEEQLDSETGSASAADEKKKTDGADE